MENIEHVHEHVLQRLLTLNGADSEFRFSTRISNRYGRLKQGYWFHGNADYLTVSFWSGMDWKNKTPNIQFIITEDECFLSISTTDSEEKQKFVDRYLRDAIEDLEGDWKYYKHYGDPRDEERGYLKFLDVFLDGDKLVIDRIIREHEKQLIEAENGLGFIDEADFERRIEKVLRYRKELQSEIIQKGLETVTKSLENDVPKTLASVTVDRFPGLKAPCVIEDIEKGNRCIFLTGENGAGKSTLLKAIGAALMQDHSQMTGTEYDVTLRLWAYEAQMERSFTGQDVHDKQLVTGEGYAAYGPHRLVVNESLNGHIQSFQDLPENGSLFHNSALIDIERGLQELMRRNKSVGDAIADKREIIMGAIGDIIPGFQNIIWSTGEGEAYKRARYVIRYGENEQALDETQKRYDKTGIEDEGANVTAVYFNELATGARSVLAMLGDMMVRLFQQQPHVTDVSELKGIVLIDEVDIHLHPSFQKMLIKRLVDCFQNVQFVISTHSPIPLLGAPEKSVFLLVKRGFDQVTTVREIPGLEIQKLTPNTILTSPIFGMQDILHKDWKQNEDGWIQTETSYDAVIAHKNQLDSLMAKYNQRRQRHDQTRPAN